MQQPTYIAFCNNLHFTSAKNTFMAMIAELTSYLDEYADEIDGTPFENVSYDNLGLDMIVYFPFISDDE